MELSCCEKRLKADLLAFVFRLPPSSGCITVLNVGNAPELASDSLGGT